ncbi:protein CASC3 isoform X2 [Nilaparvata lugens]|uniref:protein CASC3 isoform X2 n=1 Tax=Nilaparvata lugens TaxID=108931 RepID=UPI00193E23B8|nr:protein CASC3 isoform X2 [Nilaparvata lugens]
MAEVSLGEQDSPNTISDISEKVDKLELDSIVKEVASTMEEESSIQPVQEDSKESSAPLETTADDSEYEEADDDDGETKPVSKLRSKDSDDESVDSKDAEGKSSASDVEDADERSKGDGEEKEEEKEKKLDDDEDRRNPQYIPKKGAFYEHDDRTTVESEANDTKEPGVDVEADVIANRNNANDVPNRPIRPKKVWTDSTGDMWSHDLYVEEEQSPKSQRELINTYGYDIRNEESPPKARRRRRYGRGPKSYTRKWDDEPAYKSNNAGNTSRSGGSRRSFVNKPSEFPEISPNKNREQKNEETPQKDVDSSRGRREASKPKIEDIKTNSNQNSVIKRRETNRQRSRSRPKTETNKPVESSRQSTNSIVQNNKPDDAQKRGGRGHFSGYGPLPCLEFTPSRGRGRTLPDSKLEDYAYGPCYKPLPNSQQFSKEELDVFPLISQSNPPIATNDEIDLHSNTNEKRPTEPVNRSKRYSAQRQRSLPETNMTYSPPVPPPTAPAFFQPDPHLVAVPDYPPPQPPPMPMVAFAPPPFAPPPPAQPAYAAAYPMPTVIRTPQLPPPQLAPPQMQPPQMPPPQMQPPQMPPQMQPPQMPPQMQPQMAPPQLPPPHPQPVQQVQEVYQGQNGITYYSPQSQAAIPRQTPSRRKKVAIPILPPPEAADMSLPPHPLGHPEQADAQP